jgi:hypothetical protein
MTWLRKYLIPHEDESAPPPTQSNPDVDKIVEERVKEALSKASEKWLAEVNTLKEKTKLTAAEKEKLAERIEQLQSEYMTKEQLAAKEAAKLSKKFETEIEALKAENALWKNQFIDTTVNREITEAAIKHNAFNPQQVIAILKPQTNMVEEVDETGEKTGRLVPKVKLPTIDPKTKKPVTLELSIADAVAQIAEQDEYLNLFKDKGTTGPGFRQSANKKVDVLELAKDPESYRAWRSQMQKEKKNAG